MVASNPPGDTNLPGARPAETTGVENAVAQNRSDALAALSREVRDHNAQQKDQSYLDKAVSFVTSPFTHADSTLLTAQDTLKKAAHDPTVSTETIKAATDADAKARGTDHTADEIGGELIKTGSLFMRGRIALASTLISYGLSQAKPTDTASHQAEDFALGAVKGGIMQNLYSRLGKTELGFAAKGVAMGTSSRTVDLGLTRSTWQDGKDGSLGFAQGLDKIASGALNPSALLSDVAVFGVAHGLSAGANSLTAGALERNKFLATTFAGATFGASGGAYSELTRQQTQGEKLDVGKILSSAALHGTVDGIAAIPGGLQGTGSLAALRNLTNTGAEKITSYTSGAFDRARVGLANSLMLPGFSGEPAFAMAGGTAEGGPLSGSRGSFDFTPPRLERNEVTSKAKSAAEIAELKNSITIYDALEDAPKGKQLATWISEMQPGRESNLAVASIAIKDLPEADRFAAVDHVIKTSPEDAVDLLKAVKPAQMADLTSSIMQNTVGTERTKLLDRLYLGPASPEQVQNVFSQVKDVTGNDLNVVRSWTRDLPEPSTYAGSRRPETPVKNALIESMDIAQVGRLVFAGRENGLDVNRLAAEDPELLRTVAKVSDLANNNQIRNTADVLARWQASGSLDASTRTALSVASTANRGIGTEALPEVLGALGNRTTTQDVARTLQGLQKAATADQFASETQVWLAASTAAHLAKITPAEAQSTFFQPVSEKLADRSLDYQWRTSTARTLSTLERTGALPEGSIKLPELRMSHISGLSEADKTTLRDQSEAALRGNIPLDKLFGDGSIGKLFPHVFGNHESGGIVDRPQHDGHDFSVDKHTEAVVERVRDNPRFTQLSEKDQTNLLWAAVLHDTGKRPGLVDPGHESSSANISYGVLKTLGYSPTRIARIANLISSHPEIGFQPEHPTATKLGDQKFIDNTAVKFNHPAAATQLRILNEADIRSVQANDALWSDDLGNQIDQIAARVSTRSAELTRGTVPILTSELPQSFGLYNAPADYALLGHVSPDLDNAFFRNLPVLESHQFSVSGSLLTPENNVLFDANARIVTLFQGAPESVAQAYRGSTYSGEGTGWAQHVELFKNWHGYGDATELAHEVSQPLADLGFGDQKEAPLDDFRRKLSAYDSIDELTAQTGADSALSQGYRAVLRAMTTDGEGGKLEEANEVKLNNPTLVGVGIYRQGQQVTLEGASQADLAALFKGGSAPDWVNTTDLTQGLIVPKSVWQNLRSRDLPLIVLDP